MVSGTEYSEKRRAYIRLLQNPYASLSIDEAPAESREDQSELDRKRAYYRRLQNPCAYHDIFGEPEADFIPGAAKVVDVESPAGAYEESELQEALEEVFRNYKPYVAPSEWDRVSNYRSEFLTKAARRRVDVPRIIRCLRAFALPLMPDEKVQCNRAPAHQIIARLNMLLDEY